VFFCYLACRLEELLIRYPPEEVESKRFQKIAAALGNRTTLQVILGFHGSSENGLYATVIFAFYVYSTVTEKHGFNINQRLCSKNKCCKQV